MDHALLTHIELDKGVSDRQGEALFCFAKEATGHIVEIGCYKGRSTTYLALGTKEGNNQHIFAIDPWKDKPWIKVYDVFRENIKKGEVDDVITPIREKSHDAFLKKVPAEVFNDGIGFLHIDGDHEYPAISQDMEWIGLLKVGAKVAIHDYAMTGGWEGVRTAVDERVARGNGDLVFSAQIGSLIVFEKVR